MTHDRGEEKRLAPVRLERDGSRVDRQRRRAEHDELGVALVCTWSRTDDRRSGFQSFVWLRRRATLKICTQLLGRFGQLRRRTK